MSLSPTSVRWLRAATFVVAAHAGLVASLWAWPSSPSAAGLGREAVPIDVALVAVAPPPSPPPEQPKVAEDKPDVQPPLPPVAAKDPVVLPQPKPKPKLQPPQNPKPKPEPRLTRTAPDPATTQADDERRAAQQAAQAAGAAWKGLVASHFNRMKRYPSGASGSGTVSVSFTISRSGQVLAARMTGTSGESLFDQEALALLHRASPVPAPPPGFGGVTIPLTMAIRFNR